MQEVEQRVEAEKLDARDLKTDTPPAKVKKKAPTGSVENVTPPTPKTASVSIPGPSLADWIDASKTILTLHADIAKQNGHRALANTFLVTRDAVLALEKTAGTKKYWERF